MEKRINKKINEYIFTYKQHIKDQLLNLSKEKSFDDEKMEIFEDFQKCHISQISPETAGYI